MTPQQIARLEKQLQQNHVDIQRLWKAAFTKPEPYVGIPIAVVPGGLTTDTTDTTSTTTTTTGTTTTRPPCGDFDDISFTAEVFWEDAALGCNSTPGCPPSSVIATPTLTPILSSPCNGTLGSVVTIHGSVKWLAGCTGAEVHTSIIGPDYFTYLGNLSYQSQTFGTLPGTPAVPAVGASIPLQLVSRIFNASIFWPCRPSLVMATRVS